MLIDLRNAFDMVDHKIFFGIKDRELSWLESYLSNHKQYCLINGADPELKDVNCWGPSGIMFRAIVISSLCERLTTSSSELYGSYVH